MADNGSSVADPMEAVLPGRTLSDRFRARTTSPAESPRPGVGLEAGNPIPVLLANKRIEAQSELSCIE
jgi:hypothetical protein